MKRIALLILLVLNTSAALAQPAEPPTEKILRFRLAGEPTTLDWNLAHTPYEIYLLMNLMEGLVRLPSSLKPEPGLASGWKILDGGRKYVFQLRPGLKWSDGVPLTAQHFVDSWKRLLAPLTAAPYAYFLFDIEGAAEFNAGQISDFSLVGIKAVDERTLEVKLKQPVAHWIYLPSFWVCFPIRLDLIEKHGVGWERPGKMASVGPFLLSQYDDGRSYTMTANPAYYGGKPAIDKLVGMIVPKSEDAIDQFQKGKLDIAPQLTGAGLLKQLKKFPYLRTLYLGMNTSRFPTQNVGLRRAIAAAISKKNIIAGAGVRGTIATSFVPPGLLGYEKKAGIDFDLNRARKELAKENLSVSTLPELELMVSDSETNQKLALQVVEELKKNLGLRVKLNALPLKTYTVRRQMHSAELFLSSWVADYPDADNFLSVFFSSSGNNFTGFKNPDFDLEVANARTATSEAHRKSAYVTAQKHLLETEAVIVPLYYDVNEILMSDRVSGVEVTPLNHIFFRSARLSGSTKREPEEEKLGPLLYK